MTLIWDGEDAFMKNTSLTDEVLTLRLCWTGNVLTSRGFTTSTSLHFLKSPANISEASKNASSSSDSVRWSTASTELSSGVMAVLEASNFLTVTVLVEDMESKSSVAMVPPCVLVEEMEPKSSVAMVPQ